MYATAPLAIPPGPFGPRPPLQTGPPPSRSNPPPSSSSRKRKSAKSKLAERSVSPAMGQMPLPKRRLTDRLLNQAVRDIEPDAQAYMDLLAYERRIDATIMRKRFEFQELVKRPQKIKQKLRIYISNTFTPTKADAQTVDEAHAHWELRIEGRLLEDPITGRVVDSTRHKRKFSSFFKSLVIELDKDMYGPDNHLVEWHRKMSSGETDGFQVKRPGDKNVRCKIMLCLDYQPAQFKLEPWLARLLGIHTQTRQQIIAALWRYIKTNGLQHPDDREVIICDRYMQQIFQCERMRFADLPQKLQPLLHSPEPITIMHTVVVEGPDAAKKTACYDIEVEVEDPAIQAMHEYLSKDIGNAEITQLDQKIMEAIDFINGVRTNREFFLGFAEQPQKFISSWLLSQSRDLKVMNERIGCPEEERRAAFYRAVPDGAAKNAGIDDELSEVLRTEDWLPEAVNRYIYASIQRKRAELERSLRA